VGVEGDPAAIGRGSVREQEGGFGLGMVAIDTNDVFFENVKIGIERELSDSSIKASAHCGGAGP
jgi:hypothetical protein